jgi:hypothetical protein
MTTETPTRHDLRLLLGEARRYLAAVDAFRAEDCEPAWRREREPAPEAEPFRRMRRPATPPVA